MPGQSIATDDTGSAMYVYDRDGNPITVVFVPVPSDTSTADRIPIVGRRESSDWRRNPATSSMRPYYQSRARNSSQAQAWRTSQNSRGSGAPAAPSPTRTNGSKRKTRCPPHHYYSYKHGRCVKSKFL